MKGKLSSPSSVIVKYNESMMGSNAITTNYV